MSSETQTSVPAKNDLAVREVLGALYAAWAANDADAFAALYTEDATVAMPGVYHSGREEVRAYMAAAFAGPLRGSRGIDEPRSIRFLGLDTAVIVSEAGILLAGETALPDERLRRATWVLARREGAWRVAAYHNCPAR